MLKIFRVYLIACLLFAALTERPLFALKALESFSTAEELRSPRLQRLLNELRSGNAAALEAFWQEVKGKTPLIEPIPGNQEFMIVTFIWHADSSTKSVAMRGGPPTSLLELPLSRLSDSDLWYRTITLPRDARFTYYMRVNAPRIEVVYETAADFNENYPPQRDPLNPHIFEDSSLLLMPDAPSQMWAERQPAIAEGKLVLNKLKSGILNEEREFEVYTPAGYSQKRGPYGLLVMFDSELYTTIDLPVMLNNLIARDKIPQMVAVLIHNSAPFNRRRDLSCYDPFADFVAKELLPWVRRNYRVQVDPHYNVIGGASMGGLMAAYMGLRYSRIFGNVLIQSGSLGASVETVRNADKRLSGMELAIAETYSKEPDWLIRQFAKAQKLRLRFYIEAGRYDVGLYGADILAASRHMRDVLSLKGYWVRHFEFNGGHDGYSQRGTFPGALMALVGKGNTDQ